MTEIRCVKCRRLLMKAENLIGEIEIKCPKCGFIDLVEIKIQDGKYINIVESTIDLIKFRVSMAEHNIKEAKRLNLPTIEEM